MEIVFIAITIAINGNAGIKLSRKVTNIAVINAKNQ